MMIRPDFPEHWKTCTLIEITGDPSSPMAIIRFWAHCQHSKRWEFPDMTPDQLARICRWGSRTPACHEALIEAGFVERMDSGFAAHQWGEHNAGLVANWNNGALSRGRPKKNGAAPEKPTGIQSETGREPIDRPDQPIGQTDLKDRIGGNEPTPAFGSIQYTNQKEKSNEKPGGEVTSRKKKSGIPTQDQIRDVLTVRLPEAGYNDKEPEVADCLTPRMIDQYLRVMAQSSWRDPKGNPINDWESHVVRYMAGAINNKRRCK